MRDLLTTLINNINLIIVGKEQEIRLVLSAFLSGGHVLLEDVPGVGKTLLAKSIARSIGGNFQRIQCTSDLLPSDITGTNVWNPGFGKFEFLPGPAFTNILLADEINRATPRTQSALLEVMEEQQITIDGQTRGVPQPFLVIATQNPFEYQGTFPLPEAQMDRFTLSLSLGYPNRQEEIKMLEQQSKQDKHENSSSSLSLEDLLRLQMASREVKVLPELRGYIVALAQSSREDQEIVLGLSPRGSLALQRAAQSWAYISGRNYTIPDDIKFMAPYVLSHRLIPVTGKSSRKIVERLLNSVTLDTKDFN